MCDHPAAGRRPDQREEVLAALDHASLERKPTSFRAGVLFSEPWQADAFFVTLQKRAAYSPTLYRVAAVVVLAWSVLTGLGTGAYVAAPGVLLPAAAIATLWGRRATRTAVGSTPSEG